MYMKNLNNTTNFNLTFEVPMNTLKTFVEATIKKASNLSDAELVSSFAVHGCGDFVHFINFDRDSLIDLYVSDVCYDMFWSIYAKLLNTL